MRTTLYLATSTAPRTVTDLYVGMRPEGICQEVLGYFGGISNSEAPPMPDIPRNNGGLGQFTLERTAKILKDVKKTDSMVPGDPLPHLIWTFPQAFLVPVAEIYNRVNETGKWPRQWKTEYLTVIPKVPNPVGLQECRNISCTAALSKILEGQVRDKLKGELIPNGSQYGWVKKCGVEHMLVDL